MLSARILIDALLLTSLATLPVPADGMLGAVLGRAEDVPHTERGRTVAAQPPQLPFVASGAQADPRASFITHSQFPEFQTVKSAEKPKLSYENEAKQDTVHPVVQQSMFKQDLPKAVERKGDLYYSNPQPLLSVDKCQQQSLQAVKDQTASQSPGSETDPDALETSIRRRRRRATPSQVSSMRTLYSRKCVFKMVCFFGTNDPAFGHYVGNVSSLLRNIDSVLGAEEGDDYRGAYEFGRTHGGEGCHIRYNTCPMRVVDLASLIANFG